MLGTEKINSCELLKNLRRLYFTTPKSTENRRLEMRNNHMFISMFPNISGNVKLPIQHIKHPEQGTANIQHPSQAYHQVNLMPGLARNAAHPPYPAQSKTPPQAERPHLQRSPLKTASHAHQSSNYSHPRQISLLLSNMSSALLKLCDLQQQLRFCY